MLVKNHSEKDPLATKELIESLIVSDFPVARAIGKYIKAFAMKYGGASSWL